MTSFPIAGYDDAFSQPPPREWSESVPFRYIFGERGNLAFLLVLAVLLLAFMCALAAMAMTLGRTDQLARYELLKTFGIAASILGVIAILISNAANAAGIRKTRHDIKGDIQGTRLAVEEIREQTNGNLRRAVHDAAQEVRVSEHSQVMREVLTSPEFEAVIQRVVDATCARLNDLKAKDNE